MADVAQKCNNSNAIKNGAAVVFVSQRGRVDSYSPPGDMARVVPVEGIEAKLTTRFEPLKTAVSGFYYV